MLFAKKTKKKNVSAKKKSFVKPGEGSKGYKSAKVPEPEMFPPLSEEIKSTLIECRVDEPPPTIEQIENRISTLYGFKPSLQRHEARYVRAKKE